MKKELYKKQNYINSRLNRINIINSKTFKLEDNNLSILLANNSRFTVELEGIEYKGSLYKPKAKFFIEDKKSYNSLDFKRYDFIFVKRLKEALTENNDMNVIFKIYGSNSVVKQLINSFPETRTTYVKDINLMNLANSESFNFLQHDHKNKRVIFKEGKWKINSPLITPQGYELISRGNLELSMSGDGKLIANGPVKFEGKKNSGITIVGKNLGNGVVVLNAKKSSKIKYTNFIGLTASNADSLGITGSVSFYNSPVFIESSIFKNTTSEDALNLFRSDFYLSNSKFINLNSDALDIDFSDGEIVNSEFIGIGNDAIDVSGGKIIIENVYIQKVSDKAISAGENSEININNSFILDASIGLASKDLSEINSINTNIQNADLCLAAYQKKPEYGPGLIRSNQRYSSCNKVYLLEPKSSIIVGSDILTYNTESVTKLLYGVEYGKESNK